MKKAYSYIRFSSKKQINNDSVRRQTAATELYAKANDLELDEDLSMYDEAKSAFRNKHVAKGAALYEFLQAIKLGRVESGSVLLVEYLDRLSRQNPWDAMEQFTAIVRAGITIITLMDKRVYSNDTLRKDSKLLGVAQGKMELAYDESQIKSIRIGAAWNNNRTKAIAGGEKLTKHCPAWLELSQDRKEFIEIPDMVKAIRLIFQLKLEGKGVDAIAILLNQKAKIPKEGIPERPVTIRNKSGGWRGSYVTKILYNRAVYGEAQLYKTLWDEKKNEMNRIPDRDPIPNYYPVVVDKDTFLRVQALMKANRERKGNGGGRIGRVSSLFTHVVKCGLCGGAMHFHGKWQLTGGRQYLHCERSRRKNDCTAPPIKYEEFERLFFANFKELNIADLLPNADEIRIRLDDLDKQITATIQYTIEQQQLADTLTDSIKPGDDPRVVDRIKARLTSVLDLIDELSNKTAVLNEEHSELLIESKNLQANIDVSQEVYELMQTAKTDEEMISLRLRLRTEIQKLVESIKIWPVMTEDTTPKEIEPGVFKTMRSKYIKMLRIRFNGSRHSRSLLLIDFIKKE